MEGCALRCHLVVILAVISVLGELSWHPPGVETAVEVPFPKPKPAVSLLRPSLLNAASQNRQQEIKARKTTWEDT